MARKEYDAYTAEYYTQYNSTISSGETRIPICFCIDVSESMSFITNREDEYDFESGPSRSVDGVNNVKNIIMHKGKVAHRRIDEVKRVLKAMIYRMKNIPVLRNSAVISIVTFSRFADCIVEFSELDNIYNDVIDQIDIDAEQTNAAKGINMTLQRLDSVSQIIRNAGNESYKPVFIFMSDGMPTDGDASKRAGHEVRQRSEDGTLNVIPIGIDVDRGMETWLKQLSKENKVYSMMYDDEFDAVFDKITSRINRTAAVFSVDESLIREADEVEVEDDTASSKYGATSSLEEMSEFLSKLGDI